MSELGPEATPPRFSVIIPVLNESQALPATLDALRRVPELEIIVVDGGSSDATLAIARSLGACVLAAARGRGGQLHAGAMAAHGDVLWFLHADTRPQDAPGAIVAMTLALNDPAVVGGYFRLSFSPHADGRRAAPRLLTWIYPRLRWLGLWYGDSGMFLRRTTYRSAGGFAPYPLFEDLDLMRRLRRRGRIVLVSETLQTSSRRFANRGFPLTFAHWTLLQCLFWLGVSPIRLARHYRPVR
ncbi:MAG: TIGR04283 family arsenosugar biosynthesis glycosyltransferase [Terriglobales bacterium]